ICANKKQLFLATTPGAGPPPEPCDSSGNRARCEQAFRGSLSGRCSRLRERARCASRSIGRTYLLLSNRRHHVTQTICRHQPAAHSPLCPIQPEFSRAEFATASHDTVSACESRPVRNLG